MRHRRWIAYVIRDLATLAHPALRAGTQERRERMEALLAGPDRDDFNAQIQTAIVFGGMHAVVAQYPTSDAERVAGGDARRGRRRASAPAPRPGENQAN